MNVALTSRIKCSDCPIRHRAVCSRCDDDELVILDNIKKYRSYAAGETIFWRGDRLTHVASVVKGIATLNKTLEDGRTQMLGLLMPSDFIGRPGRTIIEFDVVAATEVTLCMFERQPFERLIETTPHVAQKLVKIVLDELDAAREWMLLLGRKTARERIATFIAMLMRRQNMLGPEGSKQDHTLLLTREEISNYLGLTLETVSRHFSALKNEGVLRFSDRRRFEVINLPALQIATGDDDVAVE
jgi:CRP/FNR family transcriptional regulator